MHIPLAPINTFIFAFLAGACVGSFLNVVLLRWKSGESIVFPSSHCPRCGHFLRWFENIPIFSFIFLKGHCSSCHKPIHWQYPAVEGMTAFLFILWVIRFPSLKVESFLSWPFFLSFLVLLAVADLKWRLLPHPVNNLFIVCGLLVAWLVPANWGASGVQDSLQAVLVFGGMGLLLESLWPGHLGGGDIKMAAGIGAWLGWTQSVTAFLLAFGLGAIFSLGGMIRGRMGLKSKVALGPFLAVGALGAVMVPLRCLNSWMILNPMRGVNGP